MNYWESLTTGQHIALISAIIVFGSKVLAVIYVNVRNWYNKKK